MRLEAAATVVLILSSLHPASASCPSILSRSAWGARAPASRAWRGTPVNYFIVHHTAGATCNNLSSCKHVVSGIQNYHMDVNRWWDIGYNFLIGGDGNVYEGRGWDNAGAHASGFNPDSIGVAMMGNFMNTLPTYAARSALEDLVDCAVAEGKLIEDYIVMAHQDVGDTECPGDYFYDHYVSNMHNYSG